MMLRKFLPALFAALLLALPISVDLTPSSGVEIGLSSAQAQALTDYAENAIVDRAFRAQASPAFPTTWYVALFTTACSDSATGTEVTGGSYARASLAASLANWAGTQSAGSTTASSGTGGVTSNNSAINYTTPTAGWGTVSHVGLMDAPTGGNMWVCSALTISKTINTGDTVSFPAAQVAVTMQ